MFLESLWMAKLPATPRLVTLRGPFFFYCWIFSATANNYTTVWSCCRCLLISLAPRRWGRLTLRHSSWIFLICYFCRYALHVFCARTRSAVVVTRNRQPIVPFLPFARVRSTASAYFPTPVTKRKKKHRWRISTAVVAVVARVCFTSDRRHGFVSEQTGDGQDVGRRGERENDVRREFHAGMAWVSRGKHTHTHPPTLHVGVVEGTPSAAVFPSIVTHPVILPGKR